MGEAITATTLLQYVVPSTGIGGTLLGIFIWWTITNIKNNRCKQGELEDNMKELPTEFAVIKTEHRELKKLKSVPTDIALIKQELEHITKKLDKAINNNPMRGESQ